MEGTLDEGARPPPSSVHARYFPGGERLAFFLLLVAILVLAWYTVRPVLTVLLLAAATASLSHRLYRRLLARLSWRRRLGALLMVLAVLLVVLGPLGAGAVAGARRVALEFAQLAPHAGEMRRDLVLHASRLGPLAAPIAHAAARLSSTVADAAPSIAQHAGAWAGAIGGALLSFMAALFLYALALYYFYVDGMTWRERLIHLAPIPDAYARAFLSRFREVSVSVLVGNLGTALFHAVLSGLGYWLFGVPAPLALALLTGLASFIPTVGTALVWIGPTIWLLVQRGWPWALGFVLYGVLIIGAADSLLRPLLMRRGMRMHSLLVFVAVLGGVGTFGVSGLFLGPLVMALAVAAVDIYEREPPFGEGAAGHGA